MQHEQKQQNLHFIGIKEQKLSNQVYNSSILHLSKDLHLVISRNEDLIMYNSRLKKTIQKIQLDFNGNIINSSYSSKWKVIFLQLADQNLSVFSESLIKLNQCVQIKEIRHCIDFVYLDEYGCFLVLTPQCFKVVYVEINTNHLRSLFSNAYKFTMKQIGVRVLPSEYYLPFTMRIFRDGDYIYIHNTESVKIINHTKDLNFSNKNIEETFQPKKSIILLQNICEAPEQITKILFNSSDSLLICGSIYGTLKIYKVNFGVIISTSISNYHCHEIDSNTLMIFKAFLHNNKSVLALQMYSSKIVLSVGADEYIEVISLDQMAVIEKLKTMSNLHEVEFARNNLFLGVRTVHFNKHLFQYEVCLDYELRLQHNSSITHACYEGKASIYVFTDNSINILESEGKEKEPKQTFVPPRCKSVISLVKCPYETLHDEYWLLTDQSQVYKYVISPTRTEIVGILQLHQFYDIYKHETHEKVVTMTFLDLVPLKYDSDIKEKNYYPNLSPSDEIKPVIFGCETGEIVVCSSLAPAEIICRVRHFEEPVSNILTCFIPDSEKTNGKQVHKRRTVVLSSQRQIVVILLSNYQIPEVVYKCLINQSFFLKQIGVDYCSMISFNNVKIIFPCWQQPNKLRLWISQTSFHQNQITCLEQLKYFNMQVSNAIMTGDSIGKIVIWNLCSEILLIMKTSERVNIDCCYFRRGVLIFGYGGKIFEINKQTYLSPSSQLASSRLCQNESWLDSFTTVLKSNSSLSSQTISSKLQQKSSNEKQKGETDEKFVNYLEEMKKQLLKLNKKVESKPLDRHLSTHESKSLRDESSLQEGKFKFKSRHKKAKIRLLEQSRTEKIISSDVQLPQITPKSIHFSEEQFRAPKVKNKKYEFLFHFPNVGLYSQLVKKKILE